MKKEILFDADFRTGNYSEVPMAMFDVPKEESRKKFEPTCMADYPEGYKGILNHPYYLRFTANEEYATQLKTKGSFNFSPGVDIRVTGRWKIRRFALYCLFWVMPVDDKGGKLVVEMDGVESSRSDHVAFTAHRGNNGYKDPDKKVYGVKRKMNPEKWRTYRMVIGKDNVKWYTRAFGFLWWARRHYAAFDIPNIKYYLWISIIMKFDRYPKLPEGQAEMDISRIIVYKTTDQN